MLNNSINIGVTGGIGAGKSTVCKLFNMLGIPVYNADDQAKALMTRDQNIITAIKKNFGNEAYLPDGQLNRAYFGKSLFKDDKQLKIINGIVHPAIAEDFEKWKNVHENKPYLVKEAALLIESGSYKLLDYLITVSSPLNTRIERVLSRDAHRTKEHIREIISKQLSDEERIAKSDFVITNDEQTLLIPQVLKIHDFLISLKQNG
jgi:dephospho-CoA kinase